MGGYGGWGGGVNLGGYAPTAFYPGQITQPIQPVQAPAVTFPQAGGAGGGAGGNAALQQYLASIAASNAADQAAQLVFSEWTMRVGDERLAMEKAQQAWSQTFQEKQQEFSEGITEAGLLGVYEGQQTLPAQQLQQQGALGLLGLQSSLQGPANWLKYQQLNANTPEGLRDMLAGFAGRFNFAGSAAQGTPGPATLQGRTQDLLAGGQQGTGGTGAAAGAGAGQNQFALPAPNQVNLQSWQNATPSQQQMLLGAYGAAGYDPTDVQKQLAAAGPRYVFNGGGQTQLGL